MPRVLKPERSPISAIDKCNILEATGFDTMAAGKQWRGVFARQAYARVERKKVIRMAQQHPAGTRAKCEECGKSFRTESEWQEHGKNCAGSKNADPSRLPTQEQDKITSKE